MSMFEYEMVGEGPLHEWEVTGETGELHEMHEMAGEQEAEYESEYEAEMLEAELAQELLEVSSEAELEEFLGKLISGAVKGVGSFVRSGPGRAIGGILKNVAKTALPMVGSALGTFVAPGLGTAIGGQLGSMASKLLEVQEMEMLGEAEAMNLAAQRYVRFARAAARQAAYAPRTAPPRTVARNAAVYAARQHAPGLLRPARPPYPYWRDRRAARYYGPASRPRPSGYPPRRPPWPTPRPRYDRTLWGGPSAPRAPWDEDPSPWGDAGDAFAGGDLGDGDPYGYEP